MSLTIGVTSLTVIFSVASPVSVHCRHQPPRNIHNGHYAATGYCRQWYYVADHSPDARHQYVYIAGVITVLRHFITRTSVTPPLVTS